MKKSRGHIPHDSPWGAHDPRRLHVQTNNIFQLVSFAPYHANRNHVAYTNRFVCSRSLETSGRNDFRLQLFLLPFGRQRTATTATAATAKRQRSTAAAKRPEFGDGRDKVRDGQQAQGAAAVRGHGRFRGHCGGVPQRVDVHTDTTRAVAQLQGGAETGARRAGLAHQIGRRIYRRQGLQRTDSLRGRPGHAVHASGQQTHQVRTSMSPHSSLIHLVL